MSVRPFELPDLGQGIRYGWQDDGAGGGTVVSQQNHEPILEQNKAMATHNDGYTPSRDMRRVASIPMLLIHKWLTEEGWDAFAPENSDKLKATLNSSEYLYLRTAPGRL
jgi:hypothetical protein